MRRTRSQEQITVLSLTLWLGMTNVRRLRIKPKGIGVTRSVSTIGDSFIMSAVLICMSLGDMRGFAPHSSATRG